ncbi:putative arginine--tRNA ligase, mitochondrial [Pelodytes ibericus]
MSCLFRRAIAEQVSRVVGIPVETVAQSVRAVPVHRKHESPDFQLFVNSLLDDSHSDATSSIQEKAQKLASKLTCNSVISEIGAIRGSVTFKISRDLLTKTVLHKLSKHGPRFGLDTELLSPLHKGKTIVEYSSPNIAKKFHVGHLRSTIIGNFIANLKEAVGNEVIRINYLGDWGLQFGLLGIGFSRFGCEEKLKANPLEHLCDVYVKINDAAEQDENLRMSAKDFLKKLEDGHPEALNMWTNLRDLSVKEYIKVYKRLGVRFDDYSGESIYKDKAQGVLQLLRNKGLLKTTENGTGVIDVSEAQDLTSYKTVVRSDGTSLYITRDLAAAIDRMEKYNFDEMIYVTDKSQQTHFQQMFKILKILGKEQAKRCHHVSFGLVQGMKTRRGDVIFLEDVLDEARTRMLQNMSATGTSKDLEDPAGTAEKIGIAALIVQDLKGPLLADYNFDWDRALQSYGDTGVFLQYTHARLHSLQAHWEMRDFKHIDISCLQEPPIIFTLQHLLRYDEVILQCLEDHQPRYLINYLMGLGHLANVAHRTLPVKGSTLQVAQARLFFFNHVRMVLANTMKLLGISPVAKM